MKITKMNVEYFTLTEEERNAIKLVDKMLTKIYTMHSDSLTLENQFTGECIDIKELPRTIGILGYFEQEQPIISRVIDNLPDSIM